MKNLKMKKVLLLVFAVVFSVFTYAQDAAEKLNQAQEAMKAQDYAKAYQLYDDAMSNIGDVQVDAAINFNIGYAAYKAENLEGAVKYFDKAIESGTNVSKSHEYKALAYNDKKDYENAVASFEKAIETATEGADELNYSAGVAAYRAKMFEKAAGFFGNAYDAGYKGESAIYYKAVVLKSMDKDDEYKATLEEGIAKYPGDDKLSKALAGVYVSEANDLYKAGADILGEANKKVNAGSLTTDDAAYTAEVAKAQVEFKKAIEILEKAKTLDASNKNVQTLLDACKAVL
jgi:tetratricopeptide (TPR) repeat protein